MRIKTTLKSNFIAGLILVGPLLVTLFLIKTGIDVLGGVLAPVIEGTRLETFTANNILLAQLLAVVLFAVLVTILGFLAQRSIGRRLFGRTGRVVNFIPVFRTIYGTIREMATSVVGRGSDFESVVYIEYPRDGVYRLGLVTGDSPQDLEETAGEDARNVFVPGSPNPTGGALIMVPVSNIHESEMSVSAAIRFLMTTGMDSSRGPIKLDEDDVVVPDESPGSAD